jgi:hypothetical protein
LDFTSLDWLEVEAWEEVRGEVLAEVKVGVEGWGKAGLWVVAAGWAEVLAEVGVEDKRRGRNGGFLNRRRVK